MVLRTARTTIQCAPAAAVSLASGMPRFGMYGPPRGVGVMQPSMGHTDMHRMHPVQSVLTTSGKCVWGSNVIAW